MKDERRTTKDKLKITNHALRFIPHPSSFILYRAGDTAQME